MMKTICIAALSTIVLGTDAYACRCVPLDVEKAAAEAVAIVEAEVVDLVELAKDEFGGTSAVAIFEVSASWKARVPKRIVVVDADPCRVNYEKGSAYLVYLKPLRQGMFTSSPCDGSGLLSDAKARQVWLEKNALSFPVAADAKVAE